MMECSVCGRGEAYVCPKCVDRLTQLWRDEITMKDGEPDEKRR